jgi:NAD-dependent DNA ligase
MIFQYTNYHLEKNFTEMDSKEIYTKIFLKAAGLEISDDQLKEKKVLWWYNVRNKSSGGLRLTDEGLEFIQKQSNLKTYTVELPETVKITPQILVWLDNFIACPYHLDKKSITVSEEKTVFELYLFSGDIRKMGFNKAMSKK